MHALVSLHNITTTTSTIIETGRTRVPGASHLENSSITSFFSLIQWGLLPISIVLPHIILLSPTSENTCRTHATCLIYGGLPPGSVRQPQQRSRVDVRSLSRVHCTTHSSHIDCIEFHLAVSQPAIQRVDSPRIIDNSSSHQTRIMCFACWRWRSSVRIVGRFRKSAAIKVEVDLDGLRCVFPWFSGWLCRWDDNMRDAAGAGACSRRFARREGAFPWESETNFLVSVSRVNAQHH